MLLKSGSQKGKKAKAGGRPSRPAGLLPTLVDNAGDAIEVVDARTLDYIEVSQTACDFLGYSREEFLNLNVRDVDPAVDERAIKHIAHQLRELGSLKFETSRRRKDGHLIPVEINVKQVLLDRLYNVNFVRDISARKQAEQERQDLLQEVRHSASELEAIFATQTDAILVYDQHLRVRRSTPRFAQDYGFDPTGLHLGEVLQRVNCRGMSNRPVAFTNRLPSSKALRGKQVYSRPFKVTRTDGAEAVVEASSTPLRVDGRIHGVVSVWHDVTALRKAADDVAAYAKQLEHAMMGTLNAVSYMVAQRDPYTAGHERRVGLIAADLGTEMEWPKAQCKSLELIGLVHDIGKIGIPAEILAKPGRLTDVEYAMVKAHVQIGYDILKGIEFPFPVAEIVYQHHERMDGSGYPRGLKGDEILPEARILAVADVLESMSSHRPYRPAQGISLALDELTKHRGTLYDAPVVDAVLSLVQQKRYHLPE